MPVLAIETSCDETALAIVKGQKIKSGFNFSILGEALFSQVKLHAEFGGVFPTVAKREHARTLTPLLAEALRQAGELGNLQFTIYNFQKERKIRKILEREQGLAEELIPFLKKIKPLKIDKIAVTVGPGLEPALWVGINFARALSLAWGIPLLGVNHMEGHILSALLKATDKRELNTESRGNNDQYSISNIQYPLLALLISGGHTELVLAKKIGSYKIIGETRDDAVGEAYDKVARMLGLPYPGGPQISLLAEQARNERGTYAEGMRKKNESPASSLHPVRVKSALTLPRPMINSKDFDFSFAGLKTAVLYTLKKIPRVTPAVKRDMALEFESAATEVLITKVKKALIQTKAKTFVIGGGVSANANIRREFGKLMKESFPSVKFFIPEQKLSTDNAVMIGLCAFFGN